MKEKSKMLTEEKVEKWIITKAALDEIKKEEMELRKELCDYILEGNIKGSKKKLIGKYQLTASAKLNSSIDKEVLNTIWEDLSVEEKACFRFDPKLVAKEYKKLSPEYTILHSAIVDKPGAPTLSFKKVEE